MSETVSKAGEILDAAEALVQTRGYNGFSFRDIAAAVGVKSSSVHYHFPTKADLGAKLARRYRERFLGRLGRPDAPDMDPTALVGRYVGVFRDALVNDGRMCLCGMLGAEVQSLPVTVAAEVRQMFEQAVDWLSRAMSGPSDALSADHFRTRALRITATVEGAMILSRTFGDSGLFDRIVDDMDQTG